MSTEQPRLRVAVLDDYQGVASSIVDWRAGELDLEVVTFTRPLAGPELRDALSDFDIVVAMRERTGFPGTVLESLPRLRLLVTTGMANSAIDLDAARDLGITVCGTRGLTSAAVELTWALILALVRHVPYEDTRLRAGYWQSTVGMSLQSKTLGIVGLGRYGREVAVIGRALGMDVIAWSQNLASESAAEIGVRAVSKDELFRTADVVSVHYRLSARSRHVIGRDELARMKPSAYLVNTSRGEIVDEAALIDALEDERIAGAALDVFDIEPVSADAPILAAPRTVLSPHLGYVTRENLSFFYTDAVKDIAAFLAGEPVRVLVDGSRP